MLCFLLRSGVFHIVLAGSGGQRDPQKTGRKVFISFATPNRTGNGATLLHDGASFSPVVCVCVCFFFYFFFAYFSLLLCLLVGRCGCCFAVSSIRFALVSCPSCFIQKAQTYTHTQPQPGSVFSTPKSTLRWPTGGGELSCVCVAAQLEFEVGATVLSSNDQKPK